MVDSNNRITIDNGNLRTIIIKRAQSDSMELYEVIVKSIEDKAVLLQEVFCYEDWVLILNDILKGLVVFSDEWN